MREASCDACAQEIVQVHDTGEHRAVIDNRHSHDTVLFHSIRHGAGELANARDFGILRHDRPDWNVQNISAALDQTAQVASGQHAFDALRVIDDDGDATAFGDHHDRLTHGIALSQYWQVLTQHDF